MNKYLRFYYLDTILLIVLILIINFCDIDQISIYSDFSSGNAFPFISVLLIIGLISLIINVLFHLTHKKFIEENLLFPKYYLIFFIIIILLGLIYTKFAIIPGLHVMYYFNFIIIGYAFLSIYTNLSFEKKKKNK